MKIGSTGDWHFCAGLDEEVSSSIVQMENKFKERQVDLIVVTGDIFDRKSDVEGRNWAAQRIRGLAGVAPVFLLYGNHDIEGDLDIFGLIRAKNTIKVQSHPFTFVDADHGVVFYFLPWFTKSGWTAMNPQASMGLGDVTVSQLALEYLAYQRSIHARLNMKHVLVSHITIAGSIAENRQPLIGEGVTLGVEDLRDVGFDGGIFGHIHLHQRIGGDTFFYNGSPVAMNYGEQPEKFFTVYDTDAGSVEWHRLNTIDRFSVELEWKNHRFEGEFDHSRCKGALVRVLVKLEEGDDIHAIKDSLREWFTELEVKELKIEPQVRPRDAVRANQIVAAEGLLEKLTIYWEATGTKPDEPTAADMIDKLRQLEEEEAASDS